MVTGRRPGLDVRSAVAAYRLTGDADAVHRLAALAAPFFQPAAPDPTAWMVRLHDRLPGTPVVAATGGEPAHVPEWSVPNREMHVCCEDPAYLPLFALRYLRTLDRAEAVRRGALPVHGAAVGARGRGLVLVGNKRAGKTTAALSLVRSFGGVFVSNDDVLLWHRDRRWTATGGPRSIGIRLSSLPDHVPPLTAATLAEAARAHPGSASTPDKRFLLPNEAVDLGCEVRANLTVDAVVELRCDPAVVPNLRRLTGVDAVALLDRYREPAADRRRPELLAALGDPPVTEAVAALAGDVACYQFVHPPHGWVSRFTAEISALALPPAPGPNEVNR
ncbi:hypothetical protein [Salinispora sp. H7-4]|uniref:hypothetical protein n=1 Tax=Salinispora sp. H7-4 TaxID=2748321 RepID=UPI0015D11C2D|nr:hypothetical protein [Salinispora sp. H7-4]NYT92304.1 hypothetical protein [Salinispora sp. H7-4]